MTRFLKRWQQTGKIRITSYNVCYTKLLRFGARPVKRALQRYVINDLSKKILADEVDRDAVIILDVKDNELVYTNA